MFLLNLNRKVVKTLFDRIIIEKSKNHDFEQMESKCWKIMFLLNLSRNVGKTQFNRI